MKYTIHRNHHDCITLSEWCLRRRFRLDLYERTNGKWEAIAEGIGIRRSGPHATIDEAIQALCDVLSENAFKVIPGTDLIGVEQ